MEESGAGRARGRRWWAREAVLLVSLAALGAMFGAAQVATNYYHGKQAQLAQLWYERGDQALQRGQPRAAIEDLRNALSYAPGNASNQLRLAQALAADGRIDEAEAYLLGLWNHQPGSGRINLELARLEARKNQPDAARYYGNAIYGAWDGDTAERRWEARMELFHYWDSRHAISQAQSELLDLAAGIPPGEYERQAFIGQLELRTGALQAALQEYRLALRTRPRFGPALAGAGAAEFGMGDYARAIPDLEGAVRADPQNREAANQLRVARLVLSSDPFQIALSDKNRADRASDGFAQAQDALQTCAELRGVKLRTENPENDLQIAWARGRVVKSLLKQLRRHPENVVELMTFVFSAEKSCASECGPLEGKDQALWLIGKMHRLTEETAQVAK